MNWTAGYVSELGYTYGYYPEMNPLHANFCLVASGIKPPTILQACELGFGQGLSINFHSIDNEVTWHGTDFNPSQAAFAQEINDLIGSKSFLSDDDFEAFAARSSKTQYDYICLHGIWSWISDANRDILIKFFKDNLKVGGLLYVSYNTLPGWSGMLAARELLTYLFLESGGSKNDLSEQIPLAFKKLEKFISTEPVYFALDKNTHNRIDVLKKQNVNYLAHELFNSDWEPMTFRSVREKLREAKLDFACTAQLLEQVDAVNFTSQQLEFMQTEVANEEVEGLKDFYTNQSFRRDYWIKGRRKLTPSQQMSYFENMSFIATEFLEDVELKIKGVLGEAELSPDVYLPILECFKDYSIISGHSLHQRLTNIGKINQNQLLEAMKVLVGKKSLAPCVSEEISEKNLLRAQKMNSFILDQAISERTIHFLVSPVTTSAIGLSNIHMLFAQAIFNGNKKLEDWIKIASLELAKNNQKLVIKGKTLDSEQSTIRELRSQAENFQSRVLPILKGLKVLNI